MHVVDVLCIYRKNLGRESSGVTRCLMQLVMPVGGFTFVAQISFTNRKDPCQPC